MQNLRIHSMSNLEASELQQQGTTLVATVVSKEDETEATICNFLPKLGNGRVKKSP